MKNRLLVAGRCGLALLLSAVVLNSPAWSVQMLFGGHAYEWVSPDGGINWTDAKAAAEASSYLSTPGHLATIGSQAEWDFVVANFPHDLTWIGLTDETSEGVFQWVTGEPLAFTAWADGPTEPNGGTNENWVFYGRRSGGAWGWNDFRDMSNAWGPPISYLIEYPVPEPTTLMHLVIGLASFLATVRALRAFGVRK